jgi:hypothetical protein
MNKKLLIIPIVLILITTITMAIFSFLNKPKVVETKTFSEIPGFSFEYPVFKGFEVKETKEINKDLYNILLKDRNTTDIKENKKEWQKIIVEKQSYSENDFEIPADAVSDPNVNNVPYFYTEESSSGYFISNYGQVVFYGKDFKIWVELDNLSGKSGFPTDQFFKKVIGTFKFDSNVVPSLPDSKSGTDVGEAEQNLFMPLAAEAMKEYKTKNNIYPKEWYLMNIDFAYGPYRTTDSEIKPQISFGNSWKPKNCDLTYVIKSADKEHFLIEAVNDKGIAQFKIDETMESPSSMEVFPFQNRDMGYQKITLQEIESQKEKLNGKKVEYIGIFESMFETSLLDKKIWLETLKNTKYIPNRKEIQGGSIGYYHAKVRVYGTLMTGEEGYGHLGMAKYQIAADKIELLEKLLNITQEQAMQIARTDAINAYKDLSPYDVMASLENDGWHVDYELKNPMPGGGPHYIINSETGKIISKRYDQ